MSIEAYYHRPAILTRLREGPLGCYIDLFAEQLQREGHCQQGAWRNLRVVSDFSHWLARRHLDVEDVSEKTVSAYQTFRRRYRCPSIFDRAALNRLLDTLRDVGACPPRPIEASDFAGQIEEDFIRHLLRDRGLAKVSVVRHLPVVRMFLRERCVCSARDFSKLTGGDIFDFVERHVHDHGPRSAQMMCWTLRSFARFLRYRGYVTADLAAIVPSIRRWKLTSLPSYLLPNQVQSVLNACKRDTPVGQRDYAILMMLARLGLRANEIVSLDLDDIDWRAGTLTVHGKGRRCAELPLPDLSGILCTRHIMRGNDHGYANEEETYGSVTGSGPRA
ncbi:tyrosine-type recombinase/integrase, partial [Cupriavidus pinatubonensis]|uniref:tyrosine-type recombinase/integrase n=1 Tax=Cupriavidus pinatubonensis TaxID=248026 RepID=UPI001CC64253